VRAFIAIPMSDEIREGILAVGRRLSSTGIRATWVKAGAIHLTLKFLGDVDLDRTMEITSALEEAAEGVGPFTIRVRDLGAFPNGRRPRVVWAGVDEDTGALIRLVENIEDRLSLLGFKKEGRRYHPHITVGRVRGAPKDLSTHLAEPFETADQEVGEFVLFQSELHPSGAIHTPLSRVSL
jgi:2'-5' RNA ligase